MAGALYNLLLVAILPLAAVFYLWRIFVLRKANRSWRCNLGCLPLLSRRPKGEPLIWLHAASVGEVIASVPVLEEVRQRVPGIRVLVTTITQSGNAVAKKFIRPEDRAGYLPLDYPPFVLRALDRVRPDVFVMVESEIWPNFLFFAKKRRVPTVLINGRVSEQSHRRALKFRWLMSWAVSGIDRLCMQTDADEKRIKAIGAKSGQVSVFGCTKFDGDDERLSLEETAHLKRDLGIPEGSRVFIAGSTNHGEEEPVLSAFLKLRHQIPDLRLIIAPRKIERADKIWALIVGMGLTPSRRTCKKEEFDVLIIDTLGELARMYAVGDIAFVGGTLVKKGGHNLIQPIIQGKPVLFGPHTFKTSSVAELLLSAGVGFRVKNAEAMAEQASLLLLNTEAAAKTGAACSRLISENKGASAKCAGVITEILKAKEERASAA